VFRYRRVIPDRLRVAAGRREIVISLRTKVADEAELRLLQAHLSVEHWLRGLGRSGSGEAEAIPQPNWIPLDIITRNERDYKADFSPLFLTGVRIQRPRLSDALDLYMKEKQAEYDAYRGRERQIRINEKIRCIRYLTEALGGDKGDC